MSHLLVIDDDDLVRSALALVLESFGHSVTAASSTREAMDSVAAGTAPDAVVADYRLRDHDTGLLAVEAVRGLLGAHVPAMILTGDTSPERLREILACGLAVLHKPVLGTTLADSVGRLLAKQPSVSRSSSCPPAQERPAAVPRPAGCASGHPSA